MRGSACAVEVDGEVRHAVAAPADEVEALHWYPSLYLPIRGATVWASCRCKQVHYECGVIGGACRIRRVVRESGGRVRVQETSAVRGRVTAEWWQALMQGRAV